MPTLRPFTPGSSAGASRVDRFAELAKHLRQTQFYYMLVCLGLLLAVFLPRDTSLERAAEQMDEVLRFRSEAASEEIWEIAGTATPRQVGAGPQMPMAAVVFDMPALDKNEAPQPSVCFIHNNDIIRGYWGGADIDGATDFRFVDTHREFVNLWDALSSDDAYYRIKRYGADAYFEQPSGTLLDTDKNRISVRLVTDPAELNDLFVAAYEHQRIAPTDAEWVDMKQNIDGVHYTHGIELKRAWNFADRGALILPVEVEPAKLPILNRMLAKSPTPYKHLRGDDYFNVHQELADWTLSGKLSELDLYSMESVLETSRVSQGEKFPVFGLGIPYGLLFEYGLAVLLVMQLFFWGHLRSFRLMVGDGPVEAWAPWLPLYANRLSRGLTAVSVAVFPVVVIGQLVAAAEYSPLPALIGAVGCVIACFILSEFVRIWRLPTEESISAGYAGNQAA